MEVKQTVLAISGIKKSGKTTLIEKLIPRLSQRGLRVAVVKHDARSFTPDTQGTDSFRLFAAGACGTLIFDSEKHSLTRRVPVARDWVPKQFPDADLVLFEGLSRSAYPKIELIPLDSHESPICNPKSCVAYVCRGDFATDKPIFRPDDLEAITDFVISFAEGGFRDA